MSVFDKELTINGKAVRSPEQQVWKNMKDIEALKENIKPEYTTSASLTSSSVSVAIASTNAPEGTTEGWLLTQDGLKFKITGGDETNLLLEYYADLKGPQGEDGAAVNIDDSIESLTKVWSSKKTSDTIKGLISDNSRDNNDKTYSQTYIRNIINNGIWYSTTQPAGTPATINVVDIVMSMRGEAYCENTIQVGDMFIYVDNNLKASELYKIDDITSGVATVTKICDIGGGKQLYQHNIIQYSSGSNTVYCAITITNYSNEKINTNEKLISYLWTNGYTSPTKALKVNGWALNTNNSQYNRDYVSIYVNSENDTHLSIIAKTPTYAIEINTNAINFSYLSDENIIPL